MHDPEGEAKAGCSRRIHFDIWSHHPFTSGGPTHHAFHKGDISLGDLGEMKALLTASYKFKHIVTGAPPAFWVTEFSLGHEPARPEGAADQAPGPLDGRGPVRHVEGRHHDGHVAGHP